ncbi:MAG: cell division protein ZapA [Bacteroidetes bacterium]|nr:MAG: cell division protein ZapA [Bacteroidota bacterium]
MADPTRTWILLGRRLTIQAPPESIARLESLLAEIDQRAQALRKVRPDVDEVTHWLMAVLSVLETLASHLDRYEAFCQRLESLLSSSQPEP